VQVRGDARLLDPGGHGRFNQEIIPKIDEAKGSRSWI
jgi:hypothetical protein